MSKHVFIFLFPSEDDLEDEGNFDDEEDPEDVSVHFAFLISKPRHLTDKCSIGLAIHVS